MQSLLFTQSSEIKMGNTYVKFRTAAVADMRHKNHKFMGIIPFLGKSLPSIHERDKKYGAAIAQIDILLPSLLINEEELSLAKKYLGHCNKLTKKLPNYYTIM